MRLISGRLTAVGGVRILVMRDHTTEHWLHIGHTGHNGRTVGQWSKWSDGQYSSAPLTSCHAYHHIYMKAIPISRTVVTAVSSDAVFINVSGRQKLVRRDSLLVSLLTFSPL